MKLFSLFKCKKSTVEKTIRKNITRKDILEFAKQHHSLHSLGLCYAIKETFDYLWRHNADIDYGTKIREVFPLFSFETAKKFGALKDEKGYWWERGEWNTGRMAYLDWLIECYKDDNTIITTINKK